MPALRSSVLFYVSCPLLVGLCSVSFQNSSQRFCIPFLGCLVAWGERGNEYSGDPFLLSPVIPSSRLPLRGLDLLVCAQFVVRPDYFVSDAEMSQRRPFFGISVGYFHMPQISVEAGVWHRKSKSSYLNGRCFSLI